MLKEKSKAMQKRAFYREFKSMLTNVSYERASTNGTFDPVTETYTGGDNGFNTTVDALFRKIKSSLVDKINLTLDDKKVTFLQDDVLFTPEENDVIEGTWRVVKIDQDPTSVFWNCYVRRV